ncbi:hypothetical protein BpHYR1_052536 [Brachionus plicatilis]|uniref:Uncharacterized protein n=1 Tax=Brachionus plicatilis TaxID=10195 RepID=A0A3M7T3V0_BRAPC|nr:hypothetical protein BpHYR1_052536 [Brachionus plicatilis]
MKILEKFTKYYSISMKQENNEQCCALYITSVWEKQNLVWNDYAQIDYVRAKNPRSIPLANIDIIATMEPINKCEVPEIPCPVLHPPASLAPKTRCTGWALLKKPPKNAEAILPPKTDNTNKSVK